MDEGELLSPTLPLAVLLLLEVEIVEAVEDEEAGNAPAVDTEVDVRAAMVEVDDEDEEEEDEEEEDTGGGIYERTLIPSINTLWSFKS